MTAKRGEPLEANLGRFWAISDDEATAISVEDVDLATGVSPYLACSPASQDCTMVEAAASAL
jgi:hypothetical protein